MMSPPGPFADHGFASKRSSLDIIEDHRARVLAEESERAHKRQLQLTEQRSSELAPEQRIRTWEKVHVLSLPSSTSHPILKVIALDTGLTLAQVREVQRARSATVAAPAL